MWRDGTARWLIGFVQYRFEEEDGRPVLYLYEVQVSCRCDDLGLHAAAFTHRTNLLQGALPSCHKAVIAYYLHASVLPAYAKRNRLQCVLS